MTSPAPDWPVLAYEVCLSAGPLDDPAQPPNSWISVTGRTEGQTTITRGKQYELDQVQPGEMAFNLRNDDGMFDPTNSLSPLYPHVIPYRLCRLRAQYPATGNMLTGDQATGWFTSQGATTTSTLPTGVVANIGALSIVPKDGTTNQYLVSSGVPAAFDVMTISGLPVIPGQTYSAEIKFTAATSSDYHIDIVWGGTRVTGATVTGTSGTCTITATAPANALTAQIVVAAGAVSNSASPSFFNLQWEASATPSTWVTPGTWYTLFTGYIERWPQSWTSAGNYGVCQLTAVDRFTWLANRGLGWPAYLEMLSLSPFRFLALDDSAGATTFADQASGLAGPTIYTPRSGVFQTVSVGNQLQGSPAPLGVAGPVVTMTNAASQTGAQLIDLTRGQKGGAFTSPWTRVLAFRSPNVLALASTNAALSFTQPFQPNQPASSLYIGGSYDSAGNFTQLGASIKNQGVQVAASTNVTANLSDGKWHLIAVAISGNTLSVWFDGAPVTVSNTGTFPALVGGTDVLGGQLASATNKSTPGMAGDYSFFADFNRVLSNTEVANLYQAYQYAWGSQSPTHSESSDARYGRLLAWATVGGTFRIGAGSTVLYGPATDVTGGDSPTGLLDALQNVVDTESGQHFIAGDGTITFQGRSARYNQSPIRTFGENGGEIPYLNAAFDLDPTLVTNDVTINAQSPLASASSSRSTDATSISTYGDLTTNRTVNTLDGSEIQSAGQYLLYEGKNPMLRLEQLPVDIGANPTLWGTLLPLELGQTVTVNRRPSSAPAISMNGFIEQIQWAIGDDRTCSWTAQVSNSALHNFGKFDDAVYGKFDSTLIFGY